MCSKKKKETHIIIDSIILRQVLSLNSSRIHLRTRGTIIQTKTPETVTNIYRSAGVYIVQLVDILHIGSL